MSKKTFKIDPGHGGTDPGANGFGVKEKDWALEMSLYVDKRLKELGIKSSLTRSNDKTLSPTTRTNLVKGNDYCISFHWNAFNGKARGIETIHSIHGGKEFATSIANELVKATGLPLRRVFTKKLANGNDYYFMHRQTGSTRTVIVEFGFIDHKQDNDFYKNDSNFRKAGEAVIRAVCKEIGVKYVAPGGAKVDKVTAPIKKGKLYKVQTGAFSDKKNAEGLARQLKKDGYETHIVYE